MPRLVLALLVFAGCNGGSDTSTDTSPAPDDTGTAPVLGDPTGLPQGTYLVGMSVAAVGGLVLPLQLDVESVGIADGKTAFSKFDLRAVGEGDALSDILVSAPGIEVSLDGGFDAELPEFELPAEYSVTHSPVTVLATFTADAVTEEAFCGTVGGTLPSVNDLSLEGSTFAAVPWDDRTDVVAASCEVGPTELPRIEDCPTLVDGSNVDFPSGGLQRTFEVVLPDGYDPTGSYPLVFVYHGFGGTAEEMLATGILPVATDVILIAAQAQELAGTAAWDAFSPPPVNTDLALFDDLLTCAKESFAVDSSRIHVTGMSYGGLMTGYLAATRADIIASAAPMSGGVGVDPIASNYAMPALVVWGGVDDYAVGQNFDVLAHAMMDLFLANDQFVVGCDHGLGHTLDPSFWPWVMQFLLDHPRNLVAEPYATALPPAFPDYCTIR